MNIWLVLILFFLAMILWRSYTVFKIIKRMKEQVQMKGRPYYRYYGTGKTRYEQRPAVPDEATVENTIEAEFKHK